MIAVIMLDSPEFLVRKSIMVCGVRMDWIPSRASTTSYSFRRNTIFLDLTLIYQCELNIRRLAFYVVSGNGLPVPSILNTFWNIARKTNTNSPRSNSTVNSFFSFFFFFFYNTRRFNPYALLPVVWALYEITNIFTKFMRDGRFLPPLF